MIQTPPGWLREVRADHVHLYPPPTDTPGSLGEFRYRERYGPLRTMRQVVAAKLAPPAHPGVEILAVGDPERLVTVEGEYAAFVKISATVRSRPARRIMSAVFGNAFTTLLDGITATPNLFDEFEAIARELTFQTRLLLGVRRRRFVYETPSTWHAIANVLVTNWYPSDFPKHHARLLVFPASPRNKPPEQLLSHHLEAERARDIPIKSVTGPKTLTSRHGLSGLSWRIETNPPEFELLTQMLVVFEDRRYTYPLRFDVAGAAPPNSVFDVFARVCDSVEPIPQPEQTHAGRDAFDFWAS